MVFMLKSVLIVMLAASPSSLSLKLQPNHLAHRRAWIASAATLLVPAAVGADEGMDSLTKELLDRTDRNRAANADAVKRRASGVPFSSGVQQAAPSAPSRPSFELSSQLQPAANAFVVNTATGATVELTATELAELTRVGRVKESKDFGRAPRFLCVAPKAPVNFYELPLMKASASPMSFDTNLNLRGDALATKQAELLALRESAEKKLAAPPPVEGWVAPVFKGERSFEIGMCGEGMFAKPCSERGVMPHDLRRVSIPDLVAPQ